MEKLKSIADIMNEIQNAKNAPVNELPVEHDALISKLDDNGKIAAVKLIANSQSKDVARKTFLSTFEGTTVEKVMNQINARARVK